LIAKGRARLSDFAIEKEGSAFLDHCRRLRREPRRVLSKGICADGWTEPTAIVGLPSWEQRSRLELTVAPMPASRHVRFYHGANSLGGFDLAAEKAQQIAFTLHPRGRPLVLKVANAANLNPEDHRIHGLRMDGVRLTSEDGQIAVLWPDPP
jgi:hypothetical protein